MKYYVVKTNDSSNAMYVRVLKEGVFKYICIVDDVLLDDEIMIGTDNWDEAEEYAETHWL